MTSSMLVLLISTPVKKTCMLCFHYAKHSIYLLNHLRLKVQLLHYPFWAYILALSLQASKETRLPITINQLRILKQQLRLCNCYITLEQHVLWVVLTLAFYGFFRAGELVPSLHWSDIVISSNQQYFISQR